MKPDELPPCGLYQTVSPAGGIPSGRLVYFHNHGTPGPGLYLPERWTNNRAHFSPKGHTIPEDFDGTSLRSLPAEGFYRVKTAFHCCAKKCVRYEPEAFLQLGYNGAARALLFIPQLASGTITVGDRGTIIDDAALANLIALRIPETERRDDLALPRGIVVH